MKERARPPQHNVRRVGGRRLPATLDRRFEAIVFDWDGTAVPDRRSDATRLRELVEELCSLAFEVIVVSGTHSENVDGQLQARPPGPGRLYLCVNRGSEVYRAHEHGLQVVERRLATREENAALDVAVAATVDALARRGLETEIVSNRLNRRKIDLIPLAEWADPPKARITELLAAVESRLRRAGFAALAEAAEVARVSARGAGLADPRVTSDAKHLEIGLTDKSDAAHWIFAGLRRRGIAPGLVLLAGDEFGPLGGLPGSDSLLLVPEGNRATVISVGAEPTGPPPGVISLPGGPERFVEILEDQLARRRRGDVPDVDADPDWTLTIDGFDPELERVHESLLTLASGRLGTRGSIVLAHGASAPGVLAAGVYEGLGAETALARCPDWTRLHGELPVDPLLRRRLDLRQGVLRQELARPDGSLIAFQLSSLARPGIVAMRAQDHAALPPHGNSRTQRGALVAVSRDTRRPAHLDRLAAYGESEDEALAALAEAEEAGFDRILAEHRQAWARRWERADVVIEGDPLLQWAVRFALFHLMGSVADDGEAAVGARGLSGSGYRGHVFWDSDVFVLPFLAATHPPAARAMLEYRLRRVPTARAAAVRAGRRGARFPWESAHDGTDVTPRSAHDRTGRFVSIRTGDLEEHIVADVAWACRCYLDWTGDDAFRAGAGRTLMMETARYWASRIRLDRDGRAHINGVIGPDEYHELVDDNAFTNVMARWNLRQGAALARAESERIEWLRLADALVDGYDPETGLYEQFAGFFRLEPIVIADVAPQRPVAAELMLGRERAAFAQVVKQPDVLMLHHLLPDEVAPGSLGPNLSYYEPRTAHGSSLSPAIFAALLARAGKPNEALSALALAARIDLDDVTGTSAGGLHLATMGGLWQAIAFGFAGVRAHGGALSVDPRLPAQWRSLELRLELRGRPLSLHIDHSGVSLEGPGLRLERGDTAWEVTCR